MEEINRKLIAQLIKINENMKSIESRLDQFIERENVKREEKEQMAEYIEMENTMKELIDTFRKWEDEAEREFEFKK